MKTPKNIILVVEDNPETNRFIAESLSEEYDIVTAFDGREGLEKAIALNPTIIITDIMMPNVSGDQMIAEIRNSPSLADVPILILSAKADEDLKIKLLEKDAQDFIAKPFPEKDLQVRVKSLIKLKRFQDEIKHSSEKLRQGEQAGSQLAAIVESSEDAIISKDLKGIIISWNKGAERIFGYKAAEMIGKPINLLIPADRQNEEPEILRRIIGGERINHYDTVRQRKDGSLFDISLTISPVKNSQGVIIGASKIGRDITERKKNEEELRKFTSILEERVQERTQLLEEQTGRLRELAVELTEVEQKERRRLAEVLHDHLQQFLVAAKMRLELIERKATDIDLSSLKDAKSYIEKAVDASRQLTAELRPPVLYEGGLSAGLRFLVKKMEDQHKFRIHLFVTAEAEPASDILKVMIYQCIQELLFNTVKYAGVKECFVTVKRLEKRFIQVVVEDKGKGFNPADIVSTDKGGFGLFSIRERMKALRGEFKIESSPGQGAKFSIIVPDEMEITEPQDKIAPPQQLFVRERSQDKIVVLVADDHAIVRQSIASLLQTQSFVKEVVEASNGKEAISKAEATDPDIILMDINMPLMNGIEATQILISRKFRAKIIGLSIHPEGEMAQTMRDAGAVAYFNKGDNTNHLIETIKKLVQQSSATPQ